MSKHYKELIKAEFTPNENLQPNVNSSFDGSIRNSSRWGFLPIFARQSHSQQISVQCEHSFIPRLLSISNYNTIRKYEVLYYYLHVRKSFLWFYDKTETFILNIYTRNDMQTTFTAKSYQIWWNSKIISIVHGKIHEDDLTSRNNVCITEVKCKLIEADRY